MAPGKKKSYKLKLSSDQRKTLAAVLRLNHGAPFQWTVPNSTTPTVFVWPGQLGPLHHSKAAYDLARMVEEGMHPCIEVFWGTTAHALIQGLTSVPIGEACHMSHTTYDALRDVLREIENALNLPPGDPDDWAGLTEIATPGSDEAALCDCAGAFLERFRADKYDVTWPGNHAPPPPVGWLQSGTKQCDPLDPERDVNGVLGGIGLMAPPPPPPYTDLYGRVKSSLGA